MSAAKALITGCTGQDGSYLTEFLLNKGYEVHGLKRRSSSFNTERLDHGYQDFHECDTRFFLHYADLTDGSSLMKLLYDIRPDEIYNLAAQSHVKVSFEVPEYTADTVACGPLRILEAIRHTNLYEPRDNFDPETSHIIPALVRKCVEAVESRRQEIVLWGDGTPTREFLYVEDAAEGILAASARYDKPDPVNLGSGMEISIRDLALKIAGLTGFDGRIVWDTSQPNGQPRRCLDVSVAEREFGFRARTPFDEGLRQTVSWYLESRKALSAMGT